MRPGKLLEESPRKPIENGEPNPFQSPMAESSPRRPQRVQRRKNYLHAYSKVRLGFCLILLGYLLGFAFSVSLIWWMAANLQSGVGAERSMPEIDGYVLTYSLISGVIMFCALGLLVTAPERQERKYAVLALVLFLIANAISFFAMLEWQELGFVGVAVGLVSTFFVIAFCTEVGQSIGSQTLTKRAIIAKQLLITSLVLGGVVVALSVSLSSSPPKNGPGALGIVAGLGMLAVAVSMFATMVFQILMLIAGIVKLGNR